jgi:hypothetical protein
MCWDSLNDQVCPRENCKYNHVKGTKRNSDEVNYEAEQYEYQENVSSQTCENPENAQAQSNTNQNGDHFLVIAQQLGAQINQMHQQQQIMMTKLQALSSPNLQSHQQIHQQQVQLPNPMAPPHISRVEATNTPDSHPALNQQILIPQTQNHAMIQQPAHPQQYLYSHINQQ